MASTAAPASPTWWNQQAAVESRFSESAAPLDFDDPAFIRSRDEGLVKRISRHGARFFFAPLGGSGIADVVRFPGGVEINVNNFVLPALRRREYIADELLVMLRASLACDVVFRVDGAEPMVFDRPELTLICAPKGLRITVEGRGGVRHQGVNGIFRAGAFASAYGLEAGDLPEVLRVAMGGGGNLGRLLSLPLDHRVASLVADTIDTPLDGEMRALQYAGRLHELVAFALSAVTRSATATGAAHRATLDWREADLAQMAMARLTRQYRAPPPFALLAKDLGTNTHKLQAAFKVAYGITMAEYCLERRMREAQQLVLEAKLSMGEVAERVGYAHQSNFSAAFTAHVGMTPREYRRHRAPIDIALGDGSPARAEPKVRSRPQRS
jgi:AraC-like DNA-binding protein